MSVKRGIIYLGTDDEFIAEAQRSAGRVRDIGSWDITLMSDRHRDLPEFNRVIEIPTTDPFHWGEKITAIRQSPYDQTIYLDSDTYLVDKAGIEHIFDVLDRFDVAAAHDTHRHLDDQYSRDEIPEPSAPPSFQWYNAGVIGLSDSESVDQMLALWQDIHEEYIETFRMISDQASLREALWETDVSICTLPREYNYRIPFEQTIRGEVKIAHGHATNLPELIEFANRPRTTVQYTIDHLRIGDWYHPVEITMSIREKQLRATLASLRRDGLRKTIERIRERI